eukprot:XP_001703738.1 predicted protein [Chlamydomonas reinhardtii]
MYKSHQFTLGNNMRWLAHSGTALGQKCGRQFIHPNNTFAGTRLVLDTILDQDARNSKVYAMVRVPVDASAGQWEKAAKVVVGDVMCDQVDYRELFFALSYEGTNTKLSKGGHLSVKEVKAAGSVIYNPATKQWGLMRNVAPGEVEVWLSPTDREGAWPDNSIVEGIVVVDVRSFAFMPVFCNALENAEYTACMYEDIGVSMCADLPVTQRSKRRHCFPLIITPGPSEPDSMEVYLRPTLTAFKAFGPGTEGMTVVDAASGRTFGHKMFLGGIFADTPANRTLSLWLSHAAKNACGHCMLLGETGPNGHGTYFLGYNKPADINTALNVLLPPDYCQMPETALCGDSRIRISHAHHMDRAQVVESNHDLASALGCHGISCIAKELSYIDMNNVWVVPIAHAALFGVIKKFWHFVLGESVKKAESDFVLSVEARRRMTARASHFIITNDFNRPYRDIVPCSYWTMEEWLHWTDCFSLYVLHSHGGDPNKVVMPVVEIRKDDAGLDREFDLGRMWEMLRTAMLHYLRYDQFSEAACDSAAVTFKQFCCDSELVFGMKFATYNMHLLACRLREQERARGHVAFATEFWVERGVQQVKSGVKFRTTRCPEQIIRTQPCTGAV